MKKYKISSKKISEKKRILFEQQKKARERQKNLRRSRSFEVSFSKAVSVSYDNLAAIGETFVAVLTVFRNENSFQIFTVTKCVFSDVSYAVWNVDAY